MMQAATIKAILKNYDAAAILDMVEWCAGELAERDMPKEAVGAIEEAVNACHIVIEGHVVTGAVPVTFSDGRAVK